MLRGGEPGIDPTRTTAAQDREAEGGAGAAFDQLFAFLYDELRQLAQRQRQRWRENYTLNTTALLHEAYVKLADQSRIEVRDLGFRWGSCGKNAVLFFNWRLLQLPVRLIDYIIVHELAHLREPRHSSEFWQAIDRALPEWRKLKDALSGDGARFLVFGMGSLRSL